MFTIPLAVFCWLMARAWPRADSATVNDSIFITLLSNMAFTLAVSPPDTVTLVV